MRRPRGKPPLHLRLDFDSERSIGPGKVRLLELVQETGSISAAGRALDMSYRQAWLLIDELNGMFRSPLVEKKVGGGGGGGAEVTATGASVIRLYRDLQRRAHKATSADIRALSRLLAS